jgi:hypothetical protein
MDVAKERFMAASALKSFQNASREGHEFLLGVYANEVNEPFDQHLLVPWTVDVLMKEEAVGTLLFDAGQHVDGVTEDGACLEGDFGLVYDEADALLGVESDELVDAEDVLTRALEVPEVVGVVDQPGVVCVLVVDLN